MRDKIRRKNFSNRSIIPTEVLCCQREWSLCFHSFPPINLIDSSKIKRFNNYKYFATFPFLCEIENITVSSQFSHHRPACFFPVENLQWETMNATFNAVYHAPKPSLRYFSQSPSITAFRVVFYFDAGPIRHFYVLPFSLHDPREHKRLSAVFGETRLSSTFADLSSKAS